MSDVKADLRRVHTVLRQDDGVSLRKTFTLISNAKRVVGNSYLARNNAIQHAFITGPNGMDMKDLGTPRRVAGIALRQEAKSRAG
jgi:probable HAF family extracellular repeat protein